MPDDPNKDARDHPDLGIEIEVEGVELLAVETKGAPVVSTFDDAGIDYEEETVETDTLLTQFGLVAYRYEKNDEQRTLVERKSRPVIDDVVWTAYVFSGSPSHETIETALIDYHDTYRSPLDHPSE